MQNKILGTLALVGAPWLYLGFTLESLYPNLADSWFTGAWGLLYISGWFCSVVVLQRLGVTGNNWLGKNILRVLMVTLVLANLSNLYQIVSPDHSVFFFVLDAFWPISNIIMLVVGIMVIAAKKLTGWPRFVPLAMGLWFPLAMLTRLLPASLPFSGSLVGLYSAFAWSLLAIVVLTTAPLQANASRHRSQPQLA
jgi:hypothetical protein